MRRKILGLFLVITIFAINSKINAANNGGCDYSYIAKMKSLVSNINISYTYKMNGGMAVFDLTLSNTVPDVYLKKDYESFKYDLNQSIDGEYVMRDIIGSGKFTVYLPKCSDIKIYTIYYQVPNYNYYYNDKICEGLDEFVYCQKWGAVSLSYEELEQKIIEYKENKEKGNEIEIIQNEQSILDKIISFYVSYYVYILIIILCVCISLMKYIKKKNSFNI